MASLTGCCEQDIGTWRSVMGCCEQDTGTWRSVMGCCEQDTAILVCHKAVFLNRRTAARYRALASIIPGRERP